MKSIYVLLAMCCLWSAPLSAADTHYVVKVDGLVCPFCEFTIEKNVGKLDGVKTVDANLKEGTISVIVAEGKTLDEEALHQAITDAGFSMKSMDSHEAVEQQ